jgi:hypothetical protein
MPLRRRIGRRGGQRGLISQAQECHARRWSLKKVTSWAAIIAVPTAVTGFYGMNVPYPGFGQPSGVVTSTALIVILSGGLYLLFKRLDWL